MQAHLTSSFITPTTVDSGSSTIVSSASVTTHSGSHHLTDPGFVANSDSATTTATTTTTTANTSNSITATGTYSATSDYFSQVPSASHQFGRNSQLSSYYSTTPTDSSYPSSLFTGTSSHLSSFPGPEGSSGLPLSLDSSRSPHHYPLGTSVSTVASSKLINGMPNNIPTTNNTLNPSLSASSMFSRLNHPLNERNLQNHLIHPPSSAPLQQINAESTLNELSLYERLSEMTLNNNLDPYALMNNNENEVALSHGSSFPNHPTSPSNGPLNMDSMLTSNIVNTAPPAEENMYMTSSSAPTSRRSSPTAPSVNITPTKSPIGIPYYLHNTPTPARPSPPISNMPSTDGIDGHSTPTNLSFSPNASNYPSANFSPSFNNGSLLDKSTPNTGFSTFQHRLATAAAGSVSGSSATSSTSSSSSSSTNASSSSSSSSTAALSSPLPLDPFLSSTWRPHSPVSLSVPCSPIHRPIGSSINGLTPLRTCTVPTSSSLAFVHSSSGDLHAYSTPSSPLSVSLVSPPQSLLHPHAHASLPPPPPQPPALSHPYIPPHASSRSGVSSPVPGPLLLNPPSTVKDSVNSTSPASVLRQKRARQAQLEHYAQTSSDHEATLISVLQATLNDSMAPAPRSNSVPPPRRVHPVSSSTPSTPLASTTTTSTTSSSSSSSSSTSLGLVIPSTTSSSSASDFIDPLMSTPHLHLGRSTTQEDLSNSALDDYEVYERMVNIGFRLTNGKAPTFHQFLELMQKYDASSASASMSLPSSPPSPTPRYHASHPRSSITPPPLTQLPSPPSSGHKQRRPISSSSSSATLLGNTLGAHAGHPGGSPSGLSVHPYGLVPPTVSQHTRKHVSSHHSQSHHPHSAPFPSSHSFESMTSPSSSSSLASLTSGSTHGTKTESFRMKPNLISNSGSPVLSTSIGSTSLTKSGNTHLNSNASLMEMQHQLVALSRDQHGSRLIQQKLEYASASEKEMVYQEILPHALELMSDVFGNYVIQKFLEFGTEPQKDQLVAKMTGQVRILSLQMYGCRVIQKALEHISLPSQIQLISELHGHVLSCVQDQNGNHVIQKIIERVPAPELQFIVEAFKTSDLFYKLATHPYGCRVIQRMLEFCTHEQLASLLPCLHSCAKALMVDQYGNYVIQHVLEHGDPTAKQAMLALVHKDVFNLSKHKFGSNVVEKCFIVAHQSQSLYTFVDLILDHHGQLLLTMIRDVYANYVVQKLLELVDVPTRLRFLEFLKPHLNQLRKLAYGKHLVSKIEKYMQVAASTPIASA